MALCHSLTRMVPSPPGQRLVRSRFDSSCDPQWLQRNARLACRSDRPALHVPASPFEGGELLLEEVLAPEVVFLLVARRHRAQKS